MTDKLCDAEQELVTLKGRLKSEEVEKSVNTEAQKAADLVQEVHSAQKRRDESMMGRLQMANDEKDEMINRLKEIEQRLEDQGFSEVRSDDDFDEDMESSVENLLLKINQAETLGDMEQEYTTLAQRLELMKQRQREITAEEMQDILEQRDLARAKARKLEEELLRHQRNEVLNNTDQKLQIKLASVIQERDLAQAQVKQLKEEILKMQMIYSLHKSLAQEPYLRDQMNNTLAAYQSKLKQQVGQVDTASKENNHLISQVHDLEADLQKKEAQIEKYEKLVDILRRKLKSQHVANVEDEN
ncbi:hypothetical protein KUTeg_013088 [Tegillarca granosa]|uniref:Uncharacterized protein n=1 Tax=Tegillarca granosa TaxID=220873 RepID=A0ABQ9ESP0_TEGGR|nr:hypothetical protein KUTeg_013088 [Tegillarca granosa]